MRQEKGRRCAKLRPRVPSDIVVTWHLKSQVTHFLAAILAHKMALASVFVTAAVTVQGNTGLLVKTDIIIISISLTTFTAGQRPLQYSSK